MVVFRRNPCSCAHYAIGQRKKAHPIFYFMDFYQTDYKYSTNNSITLRLSILMNAEVLFLRTNITLCLQSLDGGSIACFKKRYRSVTTNFQFPFFLIFSFLCIILKMIRSRFRLVWFDSIFHQTTNVAGPRTRDSIQPEQVFLTAKNTQLRNYQTF